MKTTSNTNRNCKTNRFTSSYFIFFILIVLSASVSYAQFNPSPIVFGQNFIDDDCEPIGIDICPNFIGGMLNIASRNTPSKPYFVVQSYERTYPYSLNSDLQSYALAHTYFIINRAGNVGIGTDAPTETLDVVGNVKLGADNWTKLEFDGTGDNNWLFNAHNDGESFYFRAFDGSSYNYHMTIKRSTGNVGIGTTSPTERLDVDGAIKTEKLIIRPENNGYEFDISTNDGAGILKFNSTVVDNIITLSSNSGNVGIGVENPSEKLHVEGTTLLNGKVQIGNNTITSGTHNTSSVKLTVDGHAIFRKVIVTQSNWADHVFGEEYELKTLTEVEDFIIENKHLPEIPNEAEVLENGIELGEMNKLLLQKVEELTLYVIDLQSQINTLKAAE